MKLESIEYVHRKQSANQRDLGDELILKIWGGPVLDLDSINLLIALNSNQNKLFWSQNMHLCITRTK